MTESFDLHDDPPDAPVAYTIAGDEGRGWTMHASGLTFDEALALTHALGTITRARKAHHRRALSADARPQGGEVPDPSKPPHPGGRDG